MLLVEPRVVVIFEAHIPIIFKTCGCPFLQQTPNHKALKYRSPDKKNYRIGVVWVRSKFSFDKTFMCVLQDKSKNVTTNPEFT